MIYIDFNTKFSSNYVSLISTLNCEDVLTIPPNKKSFNINSSISDLNIYQGYSKSEVDIFQIKLWSNLQKWVKVNCPEISLDIIKYCTLHLSTHFSLNYISTFNLIKNLTKINNTSEYTIICSEEMVTIESDWCCPFISLLATVEALDDANIKYYLLETTSDILTSLTKMSSLNYLPSIFEAIQDENSHLIFKDKIIESRFISYQFTNRFNFLLNEESSLCIAPKSIIISPNIIGSYLQFSKNSIQPSLFESWDDFSLMNNRFAKKLESNFFNSIGKYLFPKILYSINNLNQIKFNANESKILILEEIVDLEAIPLISLFYNNNQNIFITQHSSCPIIISTENSDNKSIASKIFTNSNYSQEKYSKILINSNILPNPIIKYNLNSPIIFEYKNVITIIENDFFRKFGMPFNIELIYIEITSFINELIKLKCDFTILWRQRTNDFNPIFELLKNQFTNIIFSFDSELSLDNISSISNISIGFGQNSSLALQLLSHGVVNYFGSSNYSDHEYVPKINLFHQLIGPEHSATLIADAINNNKSSYYDTLSRQRRILESI
jgi:hypothetical protein